jgi:4-carboxymuconolactone decarboxylase
MADLSDRAAAGRETYARNFGVSPAEAERLMVRRAGPVFTREAYEAAGGPGWQSTALTDRDRSIAVIAALVSQHVTDDRLAVYLSLARRNGLDLDALTALMVLLSAYVGQPATSLAMQAVQRPADVEQ